MISAGLGLVAAETLVPSYSLTVSREGEDWVGGYSTTRFDPAEWWTSVKSGRFSSGWKQVLARPGNILIALSRPYAEMVGSDLAAFIPADRKRLRIFGLSLADVLAADLHQQIMPYDQRLQAVHAGTMTDFAQRALSHFAGLGAPGDLAADRAAVEAALSGLREPERVERARVSDDQIVARIRSYLPDTPGILASLDRLRDQDGIACEQRRFARLYRLVEAERESA